MRLPVYRVPVSSCGQPQALQHKQESLGLQKDSYALGRQLSKEKNLPETVIGQHLQGSLVYRHGAPLEQPLFLHTILPHHTPTQHTHISIILSRQPTAMLEVVDRSKSKAQPRMLVHKRRKIANIDQDIRRNWHRLYHQRNNLGAPSILQQHSPQRLHTQPVPRSQQSQVHSRQLEFVKAELKREKTSENKKKNEAIFFKKKSQQPSKTTSRRMERVASESRERMSPSPKTETKRDERSKVQVLPYMLRKPSFNSRKEMGIINHAYRNCVKRLKTEERLRRSWQLRQQVDLVNRFKGTKLYYQLVQEWKPPPESYE